MPMHTRSTTKMIMERGNGIYAFTSLSETGEGIHTHFDFGNCSSPGQSKKIYSAIPTSTSSLSSISSGSSSNQSTLDGSFSPSKFDSYHDFPHFAPRNATASNSSSRPLQRTSAQRWVRDSDTGELRVMLESKSWSPVQTVDDGQPEETSEDQIFEREYQIVMKNRNCMADLSKKLTVLEELNEDMEIDTLQMFAAARRSQVGEAPQVPRSFGPEGTEIIDETFRAPPGELGVYPQQWVTHQSTALRPQATETTIF